jgi:hypothetical protein
METEKIKEFKKLIGKKVRADYLVWGDIAYYEGILEKVNKNSVKIGGKLIKDEGLEIIVFP